MKSLLSISAALFLFLSGSPAGAQSCPGMAGVQVTLAPPVAGAPFSADDLKEYTRLGRDGTRSQEEIRGKVYRDAQGRGRCDIENVRTGQIEWASISDPVAKLNIRLNLLQKTATVTHLPQTPQAAPQPAPQAAATPHVTPDPSNVSHTEDDLGVQAIEGFRVTGKRFSNTRETGEHSVTDEWYSPDLKITLLSTRDDGRSVSYANKVVNIHAGDPDPTIFRVPEGYTVKNLYCRGSRCNYESE